MRFTKGLAFACVLGMTLGLASFVFAQDDLDSLLSDLNDAPAKSEKKAEEKTPVAAEPAPAAKAEETAPAAEPAAPVAVEAKAEEPKAAESAPVAEAKVEEPKAAEPAPVAEAKTEEPKAAESAAPVAVEAKAEEPKAAEPAPAAEAKAEEPKAVEPTPVAEVKTEAPKAAESAPAAVSADEQALNLLSDLESEPATAVAAQTPAAVNATSTSPANGGPASKPVVSTAPAAQRPVAVPVVAAPARPVGPDDALLAEITATEGLRRGSLDHQANKEINQARQAMTDRNYDEAFRLYKLASQHLNDRAETAGLRKECAEGMADAKYRAAKQALRTGDREGAVKLAKEAQKLHHPLAATLLASLAAENSQDSEKDYSEISHRINEKDYKVQRDEIRRRLRRSRQYYTTAEYDRAMEECELVIRAQPYNREAIALRQQIAEKMNSTLRKEFFAIREEMIHEIGVAWRPVYAINSTQLQPIDGGTTKTPLGRDPERTQEQSIEKRMKGMMLPAVSFRPPATIIDAVDYFRQASRDFDRPEIPVDQRGVNFVLQLGKALTSQQNGGAAADAGGGDAFSATAADESAANAAAAASSPVPQIPTIAASNISLWEALTLVCNVTGFKFKIRGSVVMVMPKDVTTDELLTRSYNVLDLFVERVNNASNDIRESGKKGAFGGGGNALEASDGSNQERDWKQFFSQMGVSWPPSSSISYIKTIGKLRVTNTADQLAIFEQALNDLNVTPTLIEIETRFVEVSQEDLNSLGFEWLLNSDYSLNVNNKLGKVLGLTPLQNSTSTSTTGTGSSGGSGLDTKPTSSSSSSSSQTGFQPNTAAGAHRSVGINGFGGTSDYSNGNRYLTTVGNHISGSGESTNDKFMRINGYLGSADVSMILHMLSQRSDTDLLSAPKVVTKSGQQAVIKVVTEYIYPQDYDVTVQSTGTTSGNNGSSSGGGSILAMVEPQNFTMREVGVILDVTPEVTSEGQMINLELKPQVVSEPTWHDYGMKVPVSTSQSSSTSTLSLSNLSGLSDAIQQQIMSLLTAQATKEQEYYNVPMEQPFFKVRSIDTKLSIYNGATVVMGGLITEERKSMDDKVPFLGDIPYIGRLFRSRSEWSNKRNLLLFVTARLVDPRGRQVMMGGGDDLSAGRRATSSGAAATTPAPAVAQ